MRKLHTYPREFQEEYCALIGVYPMLTLIPLSEAQQRSVLDRARWTRENTSNPWAESLKVLPQIVGGTGGRSRLGVYATGEMEPPPNPRERRSA